MVFSLMITNRFVFAQTKEIKAGDVPSEVKNVLNQYLTILSSAKSLDECAANVMKVAAGGLLSTDGMSISSNVKPYSLKKDFENVKFYKQPAEITRVQLQTGGYDGYKGTLIEGDIYKIWIAKKDGVKGMPAPIRIIVPKNDKSNPKVISVIGSL